jgi:hypothetical protein
MEKEFLHHVARERTERRFTVPSPRMTESSGMYATTATTTYTYTPTSFGSTRRDNSEVTARIEQGTTLVPPADRLQSGNATRSASNDVIGIVTSPEARMAMSPIFCEDRGLEAWIAGVSINVSNFYRRSNVRIGRIPMSMYSSISAQILSRAGYDLLHNHGCFPDYNLTGSAEHTERSAPAWFNVSCAWCGQRFTVTT